MASLNNTPIFKPVYIGNISQQSKSTVLKGPETTNPGDHFSYTSEQKDY